MAGKINIYQLILLGFIMFLPLGLEGQYFGRNKVQYEDFNFAILESDHFKVYYYPREKAAAQDAARMLERWYVRYLGLFEYQLRKKQPVVIYANHPDFQQTNVISSLIPQGTGGVTEGIRNRIVIPITGVYAENDHVLGHELVHAFQYDLMKRMRKGLQAARRLPLWLVEGMSEYLTKGRQSELTSMWMRDAVLHDKVPTIQQITQQARYFPYRYGHALWVYIAGNWGDDVILPLFNAVASEDWQTGAQKILKVSSDSLSQQWKEAIRKTYRSQIAHRTAPAEIGESIIKEQGKTNLAPAISPDGRHMIFISRRDLFTLDLFLAKVPSGEVITKLNRFRRDVHFDNLRFMNSSGSWSPDSKTVAFVVLRKGDNQIALFDLETKRVRRLIKTPGVDAIMHLAWSPDGKTLAFSGTSGGIGNLYLLDLASEKITQLTHDRYAQIQPDWHPEGKQLVYATDQGAHTDLESLTFADLNIALLDIASKEIQLLSMGPEIKHINPQFDAGGENLFFIASPDGFSNVYRYKFTEDQFYRITNVATGISGLTENSPALSLSRGSGQLVMTVFEDHDYHIYGLKAERTQGEMFPRSGQSWTRKLTGLPPVDQSNQGPVQTYLQQTESGLPAPQNFQYHAYNPRLKLYYVGRSGVGIAADQYGVELGGSINLLFGDMLGNQILSLTTRASGSLKDLGGELMYRNRDHRLNWGADLGHIPYGTGQTTSRLDTITVEGADVLGRVYYQYRQYTFLDRLRGLIEFPFTRNRRMELSAGMTRIDYHREVTTVKRTLDGQTIAKNKQELQTPPAKYLIHPAVAYVGDWSYTGFTSPVQGKRFRFELEGTAGTLQYISALGDYRHYLFVNSVTLACRLLHYGRYFQDADSDQLTPLQVGYQTWVRGYSPESFERSECTHETQSEACPEFDRLTGSRIGIFNAEVRLPLFGTQQFGLINFRYLPTELVAFCDGGLAWTGTDAPTLKWAPHSQKRVPVFSAGLAARFNLFGYLIAQVYYAYPFQRPGKGAHLGFVLAPGW